MPPKSKSKKAGKSSEVVDGVSTEEMTKDQLEEHVIRLREELDREREERSYFQLERDKLQSFWEITKRRLVEAKAELRSSQREREEEEERHRVEITVYKQKLKHVLFEHHNIGANLKVDGAVSTSLIQNQHMEAELRLWREVHSLQADVREKNLHTANCIKELKLKHHVELMEVTNSYDRRMRAMEQKYQKKMQTAIKAADGRREAEVLEVEDRLKGRIVTLRNDNDRARREAEEYYCTIQTRLQREQQREVAQAMEQWRRLDRDLSMAQKENKRLSESLQEAQQKLQNKSKDLSLFKAEVVTSRAHWKLIEKELRDLTVDHEMLLQAFKKVQQERDELLKKQTEVILDMQQKNGLKEMLLERALAALEDTVEKNEAKLCATLAASSVGGTAGSSAANKHQEILESKQDAIDTLQSDLSRDCEVYDDLLQTCRDNMEGLSVPLYDFPFRASKRLLVG